MIDLFLGLFVVIFAYLLFVFVIARLIIPFYGFRMYPLPAVLPEEIRQAISDLESQSKSAYEYAENVYKFVQSNWYSERLKTVTHLPLAFRTDISRIWRERGYAHCHTVNFIFCVLIGRSRFFTPAEVRVRHRFFNGVIHQYVQARIDGRWVDADPSVRYLHLPFGQRARTLFG